MRSTNYILAWSTVGILILFTIGMLKNLANTAFWEDEGETVQLGKAILKFGYPRVFDGRSFILIDNNYRADNFARLTSPYLQFYLAATAIKFAGTASDTFLVRLPFAIFAIAGVWASWFIFKKFKYSAFSLFLYSLSLSTSIQLYLYWRQARHYALQFLLGLGLLYSYLNLGKRKWNVIFLMFGVLFYHAYYPGFAGFYLGIVIHALIRKFTDKSYRLKPLIVNTIILVAVNFPAALYLHHYGQLPNNGYIKTLTAYLMDLNYFTYLKITIFSVIVMLALKRPSLSGIKTDFVKFFRIYNHSLSLVSIIIVSHLLLASFGAHNPRYASVLFPLAFLILAVSWDHLSAVISGKINIQKSFIQITSLPVFVSLVLYSHPNFFSQLAGFAKELETKYSGPVEGIVNTINSFPEHSEILIATNFEDGAIYSYLDNIFLNMLAPTAEYKFGYRLPDWVIIRKHWGQEKYLNAFLQKGNYEKIETTYCDLPYENVYLVRTHNFQTVTDCPEGYLTLYRLVP